MKKTYHPQLSDEVVIKRLNRLVEQFKKDRNKTHLDFSVPMAKKSFRISIENFEKADKLFEYSDRIFTVKDIPFIETKGEITIRLLNLPFPKNISKKSD